MDLASLKRPFTHWIYATHSDRRNNHMQKQKKNQIDTSDYYNAIVTILTHTSFIFEPPETSHKITFTTKM